MNLPAPLAPATTPPVFARGSAASAVITVGIPAFNRPQFLAEALASLTAAQAEFPWFEVVVSDDGATSDLRQVVEASGVRNLRYYANRRAFGAVDNWNRGLALATTPWVTVLHEDDLIYPWFFATIAPRLQPGVAAVCTRCVQGTTPPTLTAPENLRPPYRYAPLWFLKSSMTPFPGVAVNRLRALELGGFNPRMAGLADYDFWYRLACSGRVEVCPEVAAFYRVNEGQWTDRAWPQMLRASLVLRRRIAREQLPNAPILGRWIARFYTARMARAYARRFKDQPLTLALTRARRLERIAFSRVPSGWVWALLRLLAKRGNEGVKE
ncbi:glycosyltransferase family 2 protein [Opitutus sp. ER46]|uniref:glycosyltransferase family 2 protein n=1 Tax=Opitutus sp. ER46 TaxID=2161864 RepID=UPI000D304344|nr:glycosyltransferase family 2 protein [Opitutus sp. ER46]PTX92541.1 hypothetical protein DB354_14520 [Opitutus sp. ER46]